MDEQLIPKTIDEFLHQLPVRVTIVADWTTRTIRLDGMLLDPKTSQLLRNHCTEGFAWGYAGSGPSQLALAILLHYTDGATAQAYYQFFKMSYVARLPQCDFRQTVDLRKIMKDALAE